MDHFSAQRAQRSWDGRILAGQHPATQANDARQAAPSTQASYVMPGRRQVRQNLRNRWSVSGTEDIDRARHVPVRTVVCGNSWSPAGAVQFPDRRVVRLVLGLFRRGRLWKQLGDAGGFGRAVGWHELGHPAHPPPAGRRGEAVRVDRGGLHLGHRVHRGRLLHPQPPVRGQPPVTGHTGRAVKQQPLEHPAYAQPSWRGRG